MQHPPLPTSEVDQPDVASAASTSELTHPHSGAPCTSRDLCVAGNQLRLFADSGPLIDAMVEDIRAARHRVWLEIYTICDDRAGKAIAEALKDRARAGLQCRLMYDAIGSLTTPRAFFTDLEEAGVQVHAFHTLWNVVQRFASLRPFNRRNHRKLMVVDDQVAYFGGMNIVDQSSIHTVEDTRRLSLPASAGWRDVHVRLEGPQQAEVAQAMDVHWRSQHGKRLIRWPEWQLREMLRSREDGIFFFDSAPRFRKRRPARVLAPLIRRAQQRILLSMAYFIPVGPVLRQLLRARRRGVAVDVIVPEKSDVPLVQWASTHMYEDLLCRGIRIYERRDQMLHSKAMVIDGVWSVVGSCNLDPRSLRLNTEFLAVIRSEAVAEELTRLCEYEMEQSREVVIDHCHRRTWWQRLRDRLAWSLRRWL